MWQNGRLDQRELSTLLSSDQLSSSHCHFGAACVTHQEFLQAHLTRSFTSTSGHSVCVMKYGRGEMRGGRVLAGFHWK